MYQINVTETGKRIKSLMQSNGITPRNIQRACGFTTTQAVYKWTDGKNMPTVDNLVILASLFDTLIDDIVVVEKEQKCQKKTSISA